MSVVIGVDVGGTFTDLVMRDETDGTVVVGKTPTTTSDPDIGVLAVVDTVVPTEALGRCQYFIHGTTVGLNALIERRGAVVGLVTTRGFRDVLEIGRGDRPDPYDLRPLPADPLVPRRLRAEVSERVTADGQVLRPLDATKIRDIVARFEEEDVDAVAVVLLNSYANPEHEQQVAKALRDNGYAGDISLSSEVTGEYREYERTTTTVIDAFVRRRMGPYLRRLQDGLAARGFAGRLLVTRSGGGALTIAEALRRPFETILSGPVAGAAATARLAQALELDLTVQADVGGTSFDTAVIVGGRLPLNFEGEVAGLPLQCSWVDVRSVGAGGGSLAYVDEGGLLRVGPLSSGAVPGPACYGRGGQQATVTDAALALGMLSVGALNGGVKLDVEASRAVLQLLATPSGLADAADVAQGILRIAASHMAEAVRGVTIERGLDVREAAVVAFGGAGPLFASLIADELGSQLVVVPSNAGNFSAVGLMQSDVSRTAARTLIRAFDATTMNQIGTTASLLFETLGRRVGGETDEVLLDLRYAGQEHSLSIPIPWTSAEGLPPAAQARQLFEADYLRSYGHQLPDPVELVTVRVQRHTPLSVSRAAVPAPWWSREDSQGAPSRPVWSFQQNRWIETPVITRQDLPPTGLSGPLVVVEQTTSTIVDTGFTVRVGDYDSLLIQRQTVSAS